MLASQLALFYIRGRILGWSPFVLGLQNRPGRAPGASPPATLPAPLAILGLFRATLRYLGAILGPSWAFLGRLYLYFTSCRSQSRFFNLCFVHAERLFLESSDLCRFQSYCWRILGAILGHLGLSCSHLGAILGPSWAHLGPILGLPGAILAEFMQNLLGQISRNPKFAKANFRVTQNLLRQILRNAKFASANFV